MIRAKTANSGIDRTPGMAQRVRRNFSRMVANATSQDTPPNGLVLKDTATGDYYRLTVTAGVVTVTLL